MQGNHPQPIPQGNAGNASAPEDGPGQVPWATAPRQLVIRLSPAELPGAGTGAASSISQLHRLCPSTLPRLQASSAQGCGAACAVAEQQGDGEGLVQVVSARRRVCVHTD